MASTAPQLRRSIKGKAPGLRFERELWEQGCEFVAGIDVPRLRDNEVFRCYKIAKRFDQDISALLGAFKFEIEGGRIATARIAYGGMAATPKRAKACEEVLTGQSWSVINVENAMAALEQDFTPIGDMRASADYRMKTAKNLLMKAFLESSADQTLRVLEVGHGN